MLDHVPMNHFLRVPALSIATGDWKIKKASHAAGRSVADHDE
jgi:hypothetical protein